MSEEPASGGRQPAEGQEEHDDPNQWRVGIVECVLVHELFALPVGAIAALIGRALDAIYSPPAPSGWEVAANAAVVGSVLGSIAAALSLAGLALCDVRVTWFWSRPPLILSFGCVMGWWAFIGIVVASNV